MGEMSNREYAEIMCADHPESIPKVLAIMEEHGDNKWWLSDDPRVIGYHQLMDPRMLVPFSKFHEGIEALLGRPVWTHEFGVNYEGLKNEATNAWLGVDRTEAEKQEAIMEGMKRLQEHAKATGKEIIGIEVNEDDEV